jgi:quercetin dioxygenase-like cupin family protein
VQITRSSVDTAKGAADWFTGDVYIDAVAAAPPPSRVTANLVHFMPGARTHWHRHPLGHWLQPVTDEEYTAAPPRTD